MYKMFRHFSFLTFILLAGLQSKATSVIVLVNDTLFAPDTVYVESGDTILWQFFSNNYAVEVTQSTWNNNGNNPSIGGFDFSSSDSIWITDTTGIFYFVSPPNVPLGSKGVVVIQEPQSLSRKFLATDFAVFPLPATNAVTIRLPGCEGIISVYSADGSLVRCCSSRMNERSLTLTNLDQLKRGVYYIHLSECAEDWKAIRMVLQ